MLSNLISLFIFLSCSWAWAHEQESIDALSQDPHWLKLLHYSNPLIGKAKSDITSDDYFLSNDGKHNPKSELLATIERLNSDEVVACKFPSRKLWLERKGYTFPERKCEDFVNWTHGHGVKSISLIFASGFLGNPASFFGHPLLKFNFKDKRSPLDLMDTAINYGAFNPPNEGAIPYAIKGMFGGYQAGFTSADYFFHKNNYSELELRDLWEYELNLNPDQVSELVAHLWDMKSAKLDYYFFDDNCAYRMGELLELVIDEELVSKNAPYAIPSAIFHKLHEANLVKEFRLMGSRQTRMHEKVHTLSQSERVHLKKISQNISYLDAQKFQNLPESQKSRVLETALEYFSFRIIKDQTEDLKTAKKKLLQQRLALPPEQHNWNRLPQNPPHEAQRPVLTQFGYFSSDKHGSGGSFRFRPVYYDLIAPDAGRPRHSSLGALDLELNFTEERLWLRNLNLLSAETLNVSRTGLEGDGGIAWRFKIGADQMNLACNTCTVARLEGGAGKAWEISRHLVLYGMIDPRLQSNYQNSGHLALTPNMNALITFSKDFRINASAGRRFYLDKVPRAESIYAIEGRAGSTRTWDLRIGFQEHVDRRYSIGVGYYW